MADSPSRALVIFGDGLLPHVGEQHSNIHSLASDGCCGFLALRAPDSQDRTLSTLIQLLDLETENVQPLHKRFSGMRAAMVTNSEPAGALGEQAGFVVSHLQRNFSSDLLRSGDLMASKLVEMIGAGANVDEEASNLDLLLLHVVGGGEDDPAAAAWIDSIAGNLKRLSSKRLLLILVLGYCNTGGGQLLPESLKGNDALLRLRPRQSFSIKTGTHVENLSEDQSLLAVYHQEAVTRRDECTRVHPQEFLERCGNLSILADRFLHEVAFKLWKAPKYGA